MKIFAIVLGVLFLAGTILLVVAGASQPHSNAMGPLAFLACIAAVVVMIVLGVTFGGRNNPRRAPHRFAETSQTTGAAHTATAPSQISTPPQMSTPPAAEPDEGEPEVTT